MDRRGLTSKSLRINPNVIVSETATAGGRMTRTQEDGISRTLLPSFSNDYFKDELRWSLTFSFVLMTGSCCFHWKRYEKKRREENKPTLKAKGNNERRLETRPRDRSNCTTNLLPKKQTSVRRSLCNFLSFNCISPTTTKPDKKRKREKNETN